MHRVFLLTVLVLCFSFIVACSPSYDSQWSLITNQGYAGSITTPYTLEDY